MMVVYRSYDDIPKLKLPLGEEVFLSDSTLRDGIQMPGMVMKLEHKLMLYEGLHKIGIEKLESFVYHERHRAAIRAMQEYGYEKPEITGWSRANPSDIDIVLDVDGINEVGILMSVSDSHILDKMELSSREEAENMYLNALQYAVDHGLKTRAHLEDITRSDLTGFTLPFIKKIISIDPECTIRVCDTVGYGIPFADVGAPYGIPYIIKQMRKMGVKNIETHMHDDFGLGIANSIAGFWYGANWSNLTFLGIGERAGNAELEKILVFLKERVEGFEKYNLEPIHELATYFSRELISIPPNKAVVGSNVFAHESGIHTAGVLKNPFTYEPYPPEKVGAKRKLLIGSSSGTEIIRHRVEEVLKEDFGIDVKIEKDDERLKKIIEIIQKLYDEEKRKSCISYSELKGYVKKYFL